MLSTSMQRKGDGEQRAGSGSRYVWLSSSPATLVLQLYLLEGLPVLNRSIHGTKGSQDDQERLYGNRSGLVSVYRELVTTVQD